jgi:sec-independent protein translocase protein TatB
MFDIGWQELFIIAVLAIIVVGPKDLPGALRTVTKWLRKARSVAREFQSGIDDMVRESELDDVKKQLEGAADYDIAKELENTIDPTGAIAADIEEMEGELSQESLLEDASPAAEDSAGDGAGDVAPEAAAPEPAAESPEPTVEPAAEKPRASGGQGT